MNKTKQEPKTGYKVFTLIDNEYYSFGVGVIREVSISVLKRYLIKYSTKRYVKGRPWVAVFSTYDHAYRFLTWYGERNNIIKKIKYFPYNKEVNFMPIFKVIECMPLDTNVPIKEFLKKMNGRYRNSNSIWLPPVGTIFADRIKIIDKKDKEK